MFAATAAQASTVAVPSHGAHQRPTSRNTRPGAKRTPPAPAPPAGASRRGSRCLRRRGRLCRAVAGNDQASGVDADQASGVDAAQEAVIRLVLGGCCDATEELTTSELSRGRGLHSFTSQLNLSAFYGIGGVRKGLCGPC
jgi:hypothetical protein